MSIIQSLAEFKM